MNSVWTFDEPIEISKETDLFDYAQSYLIDGFYEPPINFGIFDKATRSNTYCGSGIQVKRNILTSTLVCSSLISLEHATAAVHDYLTSGNMYLFKVKNLLGEVVRLEHLPALYMRVGERRKKYAYIKGWMDKDIYPAERVIHLKQLDMRQEIYGIPEWFAAVSSGLLNESATLFRRKYYKNGAHAGFLLYVNNATIGVEEEDKISDQLNSLNGLGNFRNMFINGRGADKEKPELIPVGQIDAKDEFINIKNVTRDDIMAAHRVPPQLMGVMPSNTGGFGDVKKAAEVFFANEIMPLHAKLLSINDIIGQTVFTTQPYELLKQEKEA